MIGDREGDGGGVEVEVVRWCKQHRQRRDPFGSESTREGEGEVGDELSSMSTNNKVSAYRIISGTFILANHEYIHSIDLPLLPHQSSSSSIITSYSSTISRIISSIPSTPYSSSYASTLSSSTLILSRMILTSISRFSAIVAASSMLSS